MPKQDANTILEEAISSFPETFGLRAFGGDTFRIGRRTSYMDGDTPMLYVERREQCVPHYWNSFCKGTPEELRLEITPAPEVTR